MKGQWGLILALIFALIIAIFSVINVNPVTVNYLFGHAQWSLILVVLGSVLMGGLIVGSMGIVRVFRLQREVKRLKKQSDQYEKELEGVKAQVEAEAEAQAEIDEDEQKRLEEDREVEEVEDLKKE